MSPIEYTVFYAFIVLMLENRIVSSKRKLLSTILTQIAKAYLQGTNWSIEAIGTCPASILGGSANCFLMVLNGSLDWQTILYLTVS